MPKRIILKKLIIAYIVSSLLQITSVFANPLNNWQSAEAYKPKPSLFLHGFGRGNPDNWDPAKTTLGKYFSKYQPLGSYLETINFEDLNGSVDTYDPGKTNPQGNSKGWSDKVQDKINELLATNKYGVYTNKLNLVCHSMGGLAARWYLTNYSSNYVDKLILIGVPNKGSPLAKEINAVSKIPKLGWLTFIPVNSVESFVRDNLDLWISGYLKIDINGEAIDDLDISSEGSGFLKKLNDCSQPTNVDSFSIIGIRWGLPNWVLFKDWYGGDWVVDIDSQLGTNVILLKDSTTISAVHWQEPEIAVKEADNRILKFLDSTKPELEITYPGSGTTEIYESSVHIQGKVYKEYLPADSQLIINIRRQDDEYTLPTQTSFLKASDLWIPNNPDSPVAEFDEIVNFPGQGTYQVSLQAKNPAGEISDIKDIWVKVMVPEPPYPAPSGYHWVWGIITDYSNIKTSYFGQYARGYEWSEWEDNINFVTTKAIEAREIAKGNAQPSLAAYPVIVGEFTYAGCYSENPPAQHSYVYTKGEMQFTVNDYSPKPPYTLDLVPIYTISRFYSAPVPAWGGYYPLPQSVIINAPLSTIAFTSSFTATMEHVDEPFITPYYGYGTYGWVVETGWWHICYFAYDNPSVLGWILTQD